MNQYFNVCDVVGGEVEPVERNPNYTVDRQGIVRNTHTGRIMAQYKDRDGYLYVLLTNQKQRKKHFVHRLVANAFIPNPESKPQVNHINGSKSDNTLNNLEWASNSENQYHSRYCLGNYSGFPDRAVTCMDTMTTYESTRAAWRDTGVSYCHISECASGKRKSAGGYRWLYKEHLNETLS